MQILGFYDSIPATDKKAFTAGFVEMLSIYPSAVIERAISPSRGIAAYVAYPNLAKFKELLDEWHAEHVEDLRRRGALRQSRQDSLRLCPPPDAGRAHAPGELANVHIPASHPRYAALVEWSKTAEPRLWKLGKSSDGRDGIWIPLNVWQDGQASVRKTAEDQRARSLVLSQAAQKLMKDIDEARSWGERSAAE
jgi:hypothetical protein